MDYEDFELEIRSTTDGYETRVLQSPWGRVSEPFAPPFEPEALEGLLRGLESRLTRDLDRPAALRAEAFATPTPAPEEVGQALARHLFPGRVGHYLYACLGLMEGRREGGRKVGLRLRVCFDRRERFAPLAALPWELLFLDERVAFLNRDRRTPVVRYLDAGRSEPFRLRTAPRVLLVDSAPADLDTRKERREIRQALEALEGVEVETYEHPTVQGLRARLLESPVHVLHFLGHGGFNPASGQGTLCFETDDHLTQPVDGQLLGVHLQGIPSLRLVVLNACWSGVFPRYEAQDPFSGVAAELTRKGVPAVVAMQFPVSDGAAITFSRALYERLARLDPVDAAVTEARLAILAADPGSIEWATPVLFLGVEDGRVFEPVPEGSPPDPRSRGGSEEDPLRLEIRTFGEWGDADHVLDLRPLEAEDPTAGPPHGEADLVAELEGFFAQVLPEIQPLRLRFAAPASVAFAAGQLLESWSAFDLTVIQETLRGDVFELPVEPGPSSGEALWRLERVRVVDGAAQDVALAVQVSGRLVDDVARFLVAPGAPTVGRLVTVSVLPEPGPASVREGRHLLELAQRLSVAIQERAVELRGTLHLFADAPDAFFFFLGQLVRDLGSVQLYEPTANPGRWRPSLRFPR